MDSTSDWYCCVRSSVVWVSTENNMFPTLKSRKKDWILPNDLRRLHKLAIERPLSEQIPVSCDGDGETVVIFPRVLQARHFGIDGETIPRFTVELLQKTNTRTATTTSWAFTAVRTDNIHLRIHLPSICCLYLHYRKQIFYFIHIF